MPHVANFTGNNEWYTPSVYVERARHVMGSIDTDPASCAFANKTVRAARYYDIAADGLAQKWHGNVWMNPPYNRGVVDLFTRAVVDKHISGEISQAVVLVNSSTETQWFQRISRYSLGICLVERRIKFLAKNGLAVNKPVQGQVFLYIGTHGGADRFRLDFQRIGDVWLRGRTA